MRKILVRFDLFLLLILSAIEIGAVKIRVFVSILVRTHLTEKEKGLKLNT